MFGYSVLLPLLLFSSKIISIVSFKTACELLQLPRDCHCQRTRGVPISSLNETRLRCRQFSKITTDYRWSIVPYDRLAFETPNENLTLYRFAFADIRARTLRFNVQNLFLNDHAFDNAYIGQLAISHADNYGTLNFESNGQIFYGTTVTNIYIKSIDFQKPISEIIFSNAKIYILIIQSSKFYGFTNKNNLFLSRHNNTHLTTKMEYDNFLEYDLMSTTSSSYQTSNQSLPLKIRRKKKHQTARPMYETSDESSAQLPEQTVTMNITSADLPAFITIYAIQSSINTTNLTENYFPNNIEYSQTDEIELSSNYIRSIDAHAFRYLQSFEGRLLLINNHIQYISPYAFADLHLLNNLSLANNSIETLSSKHFQNFNQLYELDLSFNQIKKLSTNTFRSLQHLHTLRLNNNPLQFIDSDVFTNLTHLKELNLQGVQLIHLIDPQYSQWIWNLANLHVNYLLNTNFDLSDVAFCLLSRFNQTIFHSPRQYSCSCDVHYLYYNPDSQTNTTITYPVPSYHTNYLRLTPICLSNETSSIFDQYQNETESISSANTTDFILRGLDDRCDYKLIFLNCDAMTTTTTTTTTEFISTTEITSTSESTLPTTTEITTILTTTPWYFKYTKPPKKSVNNARKLFTVLGTLIAITITAIVLVVLWYRTKAVFKRRQKKKKIIEQQRHVSSPSNNNQYSTAPRYASSEMLSSMHSAQLTGNKSQSQALIASTSTPATVYKNVDAIVDEPIQKYIDDENQVQPENVTNDKTTEIQAITQC